MITAIKKYALLVEAIQDKVDDLHEFIVSDYHSTMCGRDRDLDLRANLIEIKSVRREIGNLAAAVTRRAYVLRAPKPRE